MPEPTNAPGPPVPELDRPIWGALNGRHSLLARHASGPDGTVLAARYEPEVAPFGAVGDPGDPAAWAALATIVGAGHRVVLMLGADAVVAPWPPAGWAVVAEIPGLQMVGRNMVPLADPGLEALGGADVAEMLNLVARTQPGPFEKRTVELGGYVGVRAAGALVAMAGRRFATDGYTEISAVCTDADQRGRGLAGRLVRSVAAGIAADGDVAFLHVATTNTTASRLYERLGMSVERAVRFVALDVTPGG